MSDDLRQALEEADFYRRSEFASPDMNAARDLIVKLADALEAKPPQFPTMLRKMWSGGEVQRWIDENWNKAPAAPRAPDVGRCNEVLREQGKAYPRTCAVCGLGPCRRAPYFPA